MSQSALDFTGAPPPRPRIAKPRRPLIGGRAPVARQASADGAALNAPNREHQVGQLLRYIEAQGMHGATDAEIERDLEWPVNVITARRNDLYADGLVVQRWPKPRRNSVRTGVAVIVTVATSAVRLVMPAAATGGGPCAKDAVSHRGNDALPERPERSLEVVTAGETASTSNRGTGQPGHRETSGASVTEHVAMLPSAPPITEPAGPARPMTADAIRTVAYGTRVILADGQPAQMRMVTRAGLATVYVFATRDLVSLDPASLLDCRDIDGELRQIKECV